MLLRVRKNGRLELGSSLRDLLQCQPDLRESSTYMIAVKEHSLTANCKGSFKTFLAGFDLGTFAARIST